MRNWLKYGLSWGLIMALLSVLITPYVFNQTLTIQQIISTSILNLIGGVGVGYLMKLFKLIKFKDQNNQSTT